MPELRQTKRKLITLFSLFIFVLSGCSDKGNPLTEEPEVSPVEAVTLKDFHYGQDPLQTMDVYLQKNRTGRTPLVVLIHGGGWTTGDKADYNVETWLRAGANVVNINYRLANTQVHIQEIIADVHQALTAVKARTLRWNIRSAGFILWGNSAGGHLALLYAYKYDTQNLVSAVVSFGGPTKLDDTESWDLESRKGLFQVLTGTAWTGGENSLALCRQYSPYYAATCKPSFFIHGEKDVVVPLRQATLMQQRLTEQGVDYEITILSNAGHSGENAPDTELRNMMLKAQQWVLKYSP